MDDLEIVLRQKVKPIIDEATVKHLGVSIDKLTEDITTKVSQTTLVDIEADTHISYKQAKRKFKKAFLTKLLLLNLGNISEVARITDQNRRSIHRLIRQFNINVRKIKRELIRPYDVKVTAVSHMIENILDDYRTVIHPDRLKQMYLNVSDLSENILRELPEAKMSFQEAQKVFELRFFRKALSENNHNIIKTAKKISIRLETLQRKLKKLNII